MPPGKRLKTEVSRLAINACPAMSDHATEPEEQCNCPKQCKLSTRTNHPVRHKSLSLWECMGRGGGGGGVNLASVFQTLLSCFGENSTSFEISRWYKTISHYL